MNAMKKRWVTSTTQQVNIKFANRGVCSGSMFADVSFAKTILKNTNKELGMAESEELAESNEQNSRRLTVFDAVSLIVGCIIGSGIFVLPPLVAGNVPNAGILILAWLFGGFIAACGALCFAELATTFPKSGGDYVYLTKAYDRLMGFLFVWFELLIVRTGNIAMMALTLGIYANEIKAIPGMQFEFGSISLDLAFAPYAVGAIVILTVTNLVGIHAGKMTQNILSSVKVVLILGVALVAFLLPQKNATPEVPSAKANSEIQSEADTQLKAASSDSEDETKTGDANSGNSKNSGESKTVEASSIWPVLSSFGLAMVFVMFTLGGWNDVAFVSGEVIAPEKNLLRSLLLGIGIVTAVYLIINLAYLYGLGFDGLRNSSAVASDLLRLYLGDFGGRAVSFLVCISCLGAINSMVFTGARIYHAMGTDHALFRGLFGKWNDSLGGPAAAIVAQSVMALIVLLTFGSMGNGLERLVNVTAIVFFAFFFLVSVSVVILRWKKPDLKRPFKIPLYPIPLIVFAVFCLFMLRSSILYAISQKNWFEFGLLAVILPAGIVAFMISERKARR